MATVNPTGAQRRPPRPVFDARAADRARSVVLNSAADLVDQLFDRGRHQLQDWADQPADFDAPAGPDEQCIVAFMQRHRTLISSCFIEEFGHAISHGSTSDGGVFTPAEWTGDCEAAPDHAGDADRKIAIMARKAQFRLSDRLTACQAQLEHVLDDNCELELSPEGLAPLQACNAFRLALIAADADVDMEAALFRLFEHAVLDALGECYAQLIQHMESAGIPAPAGTRVTDIAPAPPAPRSDATPNPAVNPDPRPEPELNESPEKAAIRRYLEDLLGNLQDDLTVSATTRSLLTRFYPPALQCVLSDRRVLDDVDHPVRRFFCELALIDLLDPRPARHAHRVASQILETLGATPNRTQVAEALRDLETELAESSGSKDAPRRASRRAVMELRQQASGLDVNRSILDFLNDCWVPLIERAAGAGATSEDFLSIRNHGQLLLDTLAQQRHGDAVAPDTLDDLLKATDRKLRLLGINRENCQSLTHRLAGLLGLNGDAQQAAAPYCEAEAQLLDELAAWTPHNEPLSAATDGLPELDDQARRLLDEVCKPDVWFRIYAGPRNSARWRKITHYDRDAQRVYFGDRNGENNLEVAAAEFAADLLEGRSRPVYDSDAFSRKLTGIIHGQSRQLDTPG